VQYKCEGSFSSWSCKLFFWKLRSKDGRARRILPPRYKNSRKDTKDAGIPT